MPTLGRKALTTNRCPHSAMPSAGTFMSTDAPAEDHVALLEGYLKPPADGFFQFSASVLSASTAVEVFIELTGTGSPMTRVIQYNSTALTALFGCDDDGDVADLPACAADRTAADLQMCQGDCDDDSECAPGLVCFLRSNGEIIPGCKGTGGGKAWDACYDPALGTAQTAVPTAPVALRADRLYRMKVLQHAGVDGATALIGMTFMCDAVPAAVMPLPLASYFASTEEVAAYRAGGYTSSTTTTTTTTTTATTTTTTTSTMTTTTTATTTLAGAASGISGGAAAGIAITTILLVAGLLAGGYFGWSHLQQKDAAKRAVRRRKEPKKGKKRAQERVQEEEAIEHGVFDANEGDLPPLPPSNGTGQGLAQPGMYLPGAAYDSVERPGSDGVGGPGANYDRVVPEGAAYAPIQPGTQAAYGGLGVPAPVMPTPTLTPTPTPAPTRTRVGGGGGGNAVASRRSRRHDAVHPDLGRRDPACYGRGCSGNSRALGQHRHV